MPPMLKLTYFDSSGRAEVLRLMLKMGDVSFDDERVSKAAFAELKPTLPYGHVPVLRVDDQVLAESQALLRYVARLTGFYPPVEDPIAVLMVEEILTAANEFTENGLIAVLAERDTDKRVALAQHLVGEVLPRQLGFLDKRLEQMASYPCFPDAATRLFVHELQIWRLVASLRSGRIPGVPRTIIDEYMTMQSIHTKVTTAMNEQYQSRPWPRVSGSTVPAPDKLKLTYWDTSGRAEPTRLALRIGGIEFEDERIERDPFRARKPTLPFGQIPVLEIGDGFVMAQSMALLRYAGLLGGLYPADQPLVAAKIDEVIARVEDMEFVLTPSVREQDPEKKKTMREQLVAGAMRDALGQLDARIVSWQKASSERGAFVLGRAISIADLAVFYLVEDLQSGRILHLPPTLVDAHETLLAVRDAVRDHPAVVQWNAVRSS